MAAAPDSPRTTATRRESGALLRLFAVLVEVAGSCPAPATAADIPPATATGHRGGT